MDLQVQISAAVALRPLAEADLAELHALIEANRDHLAPWMPWAGQNRAATGEFLATAVREAAVDEALHLAVVEHGAIVGVCGFHHLSLRDRSTLIGYWLSAAAQGRGLVTAAVAALLEFAFAELGLDRVGLRAAPANHRSSAVAERLGFAREGVLPDEDLVVYALSAAEWRRRNVSDMGANPSDS
jgi:ribosomal-protein-serine acetyltransferase